MEDLQDIFDDLTSSNVDRIKDGLHAAKDYVKNASLGTKVGLGLVGLGLLVAGVSQLGAAVSRASAMPNPPATEPDVVSTAEVVEEEDNSKTDPSAKDETVTTEVDVVENAVKGRVSSPKSKIPIL